MAMVLPSDASTALLFENVNGQFTPPWPTSPDALQSISEPLSVPDPAPVTVMFDAHVAVNDTLALVELTGVTV